MSVMFCLFGLPERIGRRVFVYSTDCKRGTNEANTSYDIDSHDTVDANKITFIETQTNVNGENIVDC